MTINECTVSENWEQICTPDNSSDPLAGHSDGEEVSYLEAPVCEAGDGFSLSGVAAEMTPHAGASVLVNKLFAGECPDGTPAIQTDPDTICCSSTEGASHYICFSQDDLLGLGLVAGLLDVISGDGEVEVEEDNTNEVEIDPLVELEERAQHEADLGNYHRATVLGRQRIAMGEADGTFYSEVASWAEEDNNLVLAYSIYSGPHSRRVPQEVSDRYDAYLKDPAPWLKAAEGMVRSGRFVEAREHLEYADKINQGHPDPNAIVFFYFTDREPSEEVDLEINRLQTEMEEIEQGLPIRLDSEIQTLKAGLGSVSVDDLPEMLLKLERLEGAQAAIKRLDSIETRVIKIDEFRSQARTQILIGALYSNTETYEEGMRTLEVLERYAVAEKRQVAIAEQMISKYPRNSQISYYLDYSSDNPAIRPFIPEDGFVTGSKVLGLYEPSLEDMRNLPIVRAYYSMSHTFSPSDLAVAGHIESLFGNIQQGHLPKDVISIENLEQYTFEIEALYQDPKVNVFLERVAENELADLEDNEGYQNRVALQESLDVLQTYSVNIAALEKADPSSIDPGQLSSFKEMLLQRGDVYSKFLKSEVTRMKKLEEPQRPNKIVCRGRDCASIPDYAWVGPRQRAAKSRLESFEKDLVRLRGIDLSQKGAVAELYQMTKAMFVYEEAHARGRIEMEIDQVAEIPSDKGGVGSVREELEEINAGEIPNVGQRTKAYQSLMKGIDKLALIRTVDSRITMYGEMRGSVNTTDRVINGLLWIGSGGSDNSPEFHRAHDFDYATKRYEKVQNLISEGKVDEARQAFLELEQAQLGNQLRDTFEFSQSFNTYAVGVGIIIAAAFTAGLAVEIVGPAAIGSLGTTWGTAVIYGTEATVFTLTHRSLTAGVSGDIRTLYDPSKSFGTNVLSFTEETALNAGMFAFLRGSGRLFMKYAERQVIGVAQRQLIREGTLQPAQKILKGSAEEALLLERVAVVRKGFFVRYGLKAGAFTTELGGFGGWEFLAANYQMAKAGTFDPIGAAGHTLFSGQAWEDRFLFLVCLKAGGALARPITQPMHEATRDIALGQYKGQLDRAEASITDARVQLENYLENGKGDFSKVLDSYRKALKDRKAILDRIPEFRDAQTYALTEHMLKEVDRFEAEHKASEKLFGEHNPYGAEFVNSNTGFISKANADAYLRALREHPNVENVQVHDNGLITFDYSGSHTGGRRSFRFFQGDRAAFDAAQERLAQKTERVENSEVPPPPEADPDATRNLRVAPAKGDLPSDPDATANQRPGRVRPVEAEPEGTATVERAVEVIDPAEIADSIPITRYSPKELLQIDFQVNDFISYYRAHPYRMTTLEALCRDSGQWGMEAKKMRDGLEWIETQTAEYNRLDREFRTTRDPATQARMDYLLGEVILPRMYKLSKSWYHEMDTAHNDAVGRFESELLPLDGALTSLEVKSIVAQREGGGEGLISFDVRYERPEGISRHIGNGFDLLGMKEFVTIEVDVATPKQAIEVRETIEAHGLETSPLTGKDLTVRLPSGTQVAVNIRIAEPYVPTLDYAQLQPGTYRIPISDIVPTQEVVFVGAVADYVSSGSADKIPIVRIIDGKVYVVDGHHHLMAAHIRNESDVSIRVEGPSAEEIQFGLQPVLHERHPDLRHWDQVQWRSGEGRQIISAEDARIDMARRLVTEKGWSLDDLQGLFGRDWMEAQRARGSETPEFLLKILK